MSTRKQLLFKYISIFCNVVVDSVNDLAGNTESQPKIKL
jgi:hypothetical protein